MIELKVPPLGESIVEATVSRWLKQPGDAVGPDDTVVELDTDKITVEVPAGRSGVLASRSANDGDVVHVGDVLGQIDETAQPASVAAGAGAAQSAAAQPPAAQTATASSPAMTGAAASDVAGVKSGPAARRAATERGLEISAIQGTGRGGAVSKPDVLAAASQAHAQTQPNRQDAGTERTGAPPTATPGTGGSNGAGQQRRAAAAAGVESDGHNEQQEHRERLNTRRKRIAENLLQSHLATAHLTTFNEIDMSAVMALRERVRDKVEKQHGVRLSFMPFFVRAACLALKDYPIVNAQLDGDEIVYKHYVNMGIAVASDQGLVVPNIKNADRKGLLEIARDIVDLAKKARDVKLTMDDLTGGSFTITNGGVFGSLVSTPIINYPQVAILGLHKIQDRPVAIDGRVEIRPMMYVALSYDHRIIDGQAAVLFLVRIKELMEDPAAMLIE